MEKIWYIIFDNREEGPFSVEDLINDPHVTEETLAWREGFDSWRPIKEIPELKDFFKKRLLEEVEPEEEGEEEIAPQDEIVLDLQKDPSFFFLILVIIILILSLTLYQLLV